MREPTPGIRALAQRLLEHESGAQAGPEDAAAGAEAVCSKLAGQLEPFIGSDGFQTLLLRALYLARSEYSVLEGVEAGTRSSTWLEGLAERVRGRDAAEVRAAVLALFARFLGLLANFIGEDLAERIVSRAWPDLPPGTAGSAFEGEAV